MDIDCQWYYTLAAHAVYTREMKNRRLASVKPPFRGECDDKTDGNQNTVMWSRNSKSDTLV